VIFTLFCYGVSVFRLAAFYRSDFGLELGHEALLGCLLVLLDLLLLYTIVVGADLLFFMLRLRQLLSLSLGLQVALSCLHDLLGSLPSLFNLLPSLLLLSF
jgi:hypothetical protein